MCGTTPHHWRGVLIPWWTDDADGLARRDRAHRVGHGRLTLEPVAGHGFWSRGTRNRVPISSHPRVLTLTVALRVEVRSAALRRFAERAFLHHPLAL